jgi:8-oxo-dGTP pyrophosphatase MutT (NUDIX family)
MQTKRISCGVIVTNGRQLLLGHATRSPRWDIPKGLAERDEPLVEAAARELHEETGLDVAPSALSPLGIHRYLRDKDLALFVWFPAEMPDPRRLYCASLIEGSTLPELDRFGIFSFETAFTMVGKNLARLLNAVQPLDHAVQNFRP